VVIAVLLFVFGPFNRPEHKQQYGYHHDTKVIPETATTVVGILLMSVKTPETC
jgi:hypothetical protein